jgi:hypothetical protein
MLTYARIRERSRALTRNRKIALAGAATLGAAALGFTVVPAGGATTTTEAVSSPTVTYRSEPSKDVKAGLTDPLYGENPAFAALEEQRKADAKKKADAAAKRKAAEAAKQKAAAEAAQVRAAKQAASRSAERAPVRKAAVKSYPNNLHGWITQALDIMDAKGIPGSYHGLHKNIMRESSGNPNAINDWDINAINGVPSKGLLQVIPPTFQAYHVPGTSWNIYDPVANITAAANYAADRYGSIDNVNSAY